MDRNWQVSRTNPDFLKHLSADASISNVLAQICINRGIKETAEINRFLFPKLEDLHDPFLMPDMKKAVERLGRAITNKERVLVHGDYDADGITSTALLVSVLRKAGVNTVYHIPDRIKEGYGFSPKAIEKAKACGASLIITADCGITAVEEVAAAASMGIDVIVTDHHVPPDDLPSAVAVIDPHRKDSAYPYKYLAGVGVVFKFIQALAQASVLNIAADELAGFLDLVAIGTIADSVPLTGENRVLAKFGLQIINQRDCRPGISSLKRVSGVKDEFSSRKLAFTVIPRINAAGRLDDAGKVVELFMTDDVDAAAATAEFLNEQNRNRQKIEAGVLKSALEMIDEENPGSAIVLSSADWHPGVIGIVASRIVERFFRPVFLFTEIGTDAKGSARSIPSFHLYNAIAECSDLFIGFGGHSQAAGIKLPAANLGAFREKINIIAKKSIKEDDMKPVLDIDAALNFEDINTKLIQEIKLLEPFGQDNPEPLLGAKAAQVLNHRIVGNNHLKMLLKQKNVHLDTIGFTLGKELERCGVNPSVDIAFFPSINEWNGNSILQLNLKAIRPSAQ